MFKMRIPGVILVIMRVYNINPYTPEKQYNYPAFKAMKPSMFSGADYACVRKFKAPIEKFNTLKDLQMWAEERLHELLHKDFSGRLQASTVQRNAMISEWSKYLTSECSTITSAFALIILSSILKELKHNNDNIPPVLNKRALAGSINDLNSILSADKNSQFDFSKIYQMNINKLYSESLFKSNGSGWIIIPSLKHDEKNFNKNIEKLKFYSADSWCTKSFNAETHLSKGDIHIYLENNRPLLCLRFVDDKLFEIQNEKNNNIIALKYLDILERYIREHGLELSITMEQSIKSAAEKKSLAEKIRQEIGVNAIADNDVYRIMDYLGFKPIYVDNGVVSIENYAQLNFPKNLTLEDIGISENKLFERIIEIRKDAFFAGTEVTNLGKLKKIKGSADFENSLVMSLGELEEIEGYANFANSLINTTGKLKRIGKWVDFEGAILETLGNLESIGGNAYFNNSRIKTLGSLIYIGGMADFTGSVVESVFPLKIIAKGYKCNNSFLKAEDFKNINKPQTV